MIKALFYKEWIKTKRVILLIGILLAASLVYAFINTGQVFRVNGAVQAWSNIILKNMSVLPDIVQWFPLLAGCLLGVVQFVPEMTNKRLKLTLHLPLPESRILSAMLLYGIVVLLACYLVLYLVLSVGMQSFYASEIIGLMAYEVVPWCLGGITAYLFTAWICIEPSWLQRVCSAIVAAGGLSLFYLDEMPGAYASFIPVLVVIAIIGFLFPFYSAARFKEGA
jgi:hypothetical protein